MADLELKYAHLGLRDTPARRANREDLQAHIETIWAEELTKARSRTLGQGPPLAPRYATGRPIRTRPDR